MKIVFVIFLRDS